VPVSGKVDVGDAGFESAVRRELWEETGFTAFRSLTDLDWAVVFPGPEGGTWRLHAFAAELDRPVDPTLSPEHDAFAWLPVDEARARLHYPDNRAAVDRLRERLAGRGANV
jgi:dATP pyrophosphohydrolase